MLNPFLESKRTLPVWQEVLNSCTEWNYGNSTANAKQRSWTLSWIPSNLLKITEAMPGFGKKKDIVLLRSIFYVVFFQTTNVVIVAWCGTKMKTLNLESKNKWNAMNKNVYGRNENLLNATQWTIWSMWRHTSQIRLCNACLWQKWQNPRAPVF